MSTLHIDSITISFGEKDILKDIYLSCETGNISGLLGRNGSGKSTLFQIIFGSIKGDTQYIKLNNTILQNQFDRKNRIAYLPQHSFLPKNIKIRKLIDLFCDKENSAKISQSELVQPFLNETSNTLSGGELRIVEVLLIIYSKAEFILLDEPFHSLSPKVVAEIKTIIKQQTDKGFVISDHQYHDVLDISDDIFLLSDGHLKPIKDLTELKRFNYLPKNI
ncbi:MULTISPECIES: ATP-binding cassette domain-containing protein [Chryseobacterium]|uniref:ATP-binding cassette domain-containing protein n=1 Tax=Chryseobacterium TaxID=59732 RepID=UPI0019590A3B|nr:MULTISPECIES: ATP-binding cassette domain-containing protein [Chryseobacterium]MBM7421361.1 ABC-type lipopolysaccharide export system ATPase subunit [Chryseobacterium sp. JUb44]MDH6211323.1 lipopolysaccharide export system ATP-binding protein [Chryseobacterium sp. BIGb0186]WSO09980.1 ATP-binding cassette domain-containing protein [Chryseobacterium scophthalmum]